LNSLKRKRNSDDVVRDPVVEVPTTWIWWRRFN
jgi:hypothetical protein